MARITGANLSLKQAEFIEAPVPLGIPLSDTLSSYSPNLIGPVIVYATLTVPAVMLLEAVLSFWAGSTGTHELMGKPD